LVARASGSGQAEVSRQQYPITSTDLTDKVAFLSWRSSPRSRPRSRLHRGGFLHSPTYDTNQRTYQELHDLPRPQRHV